MATSYNPPLPPQLRQQVAPQPAVMQYAQQGGGAIGVGQPQFEADAFLKERLSQVATLLKEVSDVLAVSKPSLMPVLQVMLEAGSSMMKGIEAGAPEGAGPGGAQIQAQVPQPNDQAGAVTMG